MPIERRPPLAALVAALALLAAPAFAEGWRLDGLEPPAEPEPALVADLHAAANAARRDAALAPLAWDVGLAAAARGHAAELARRGVLDHAGERPETRTLADRLVGVGVPYTAIGENLAFETGSADPVAVVVDGWLASPPHRANLLNDAFDRVGYGSARAADGGRYLVQVFAAVPWAPTAAAAAVANAAVRVVTLEVAVANGAPVAGLLEVDGTAERLTWHPGTQRLERSVAWDGRPADGAVRVRLGVDVGGASFLLDEAGLAVPGRGWLGDAAAPRRHVTVRAATVDDRTVERVRVALAAPPGVRAQLLVDGVHRPDARRSDGSLEAWLDVADGGRVALALAEPAGDGRLTVRHAFVVTRAGDRARLEAGR